jgi:flavin-dependent dehydrogenase
MYDAIIVGARCAGSPTAMLLARKGYRVLMLDRDTFPSDIMSTHFIQGYGIEKLDAWGLLDDLRATGCPPIEKVTFRLGELAFQPPREPGSPEAVYCPRRKVIDKLLVDAAVSAGAEMREGVTLQEVTMEDGRATGVRARSQNGAEFTEQAKIVIGADGIHSPVARQVRPMAYNEIPALTCGYYSYFSGIAMDGSELCMNEQVGLLAFPTHDGLTCVAIMRPIDRFAEFRSDIDGNFHRSLAIAAPAFAERARGAKREEKFVGTNQTQNYFRKPYGPGWALVGDAGYHRDPVTGLGMSDAFRDAQFLADAIDEGFAERAPLEEALAGYEQKRNDAAAPAYERTIALAKFPSAQELIAGMTAQPALKESETQVLEQLKESV